MVLMGIASAIAIVQGTVTPRNNKEHVAAFQRLVDSGDIWRMRDASGASAGREAQRLIRAGVVNDPHPHHKPETLGDILAAAMAAA